MIFIASGVFAYTRDTTETITIADIQTNSAKTIPALLQTLQAAETKGDKQKQAETASLLSLAYYYSGDYEDNRKYALQAIQLFTTLRDKKALANEYGELGYRLKSIDLKSAESYMQKGLSIAEKENFEQELISIYNNYGTIKQLLQQEDSALLFYQKSIDICLKYKDSISLPYSLNNIGTLYIEQQKYQLAETYFMQAMQIREQLNDQYGISDNYAYLGDLYIEQKQYQKAVDAYLHSLKIAENLHITNLMQHNYRSLAECYKELGDTKNALLYADKRQDFGDSLLNIQTNDRIVEYQIQFETAEKEKQILQQQLEAKRRNTAILLLSFLLTTLSIIAILIYRNLKIKQQQQQQEFELNEAMLMLENQKKLDEQRLTISGDLHDNIGSQLTFIISSIETLKYALKSSDEKINNRLMAISNFTRETITDLRDTIWAMNHSDIHFEEMRERISNFIKKATLSGQTIQFNFTIDEQLKHHTFSSTEGMNIYRIIQEAVNNAIKHATSNQIKISISKVENNIKLLIEDDGKGFDTTKHSDGSGLLNMEKRIKVLNGNLSVNSAKGNTQIICFFPLFS